MGYEISGAMSRATDKIKINIHSIVNSDVLKMSHKNDVRLTVAVAELDEVDREAARSCVDVEGE